jgi:fermentation-respiration switch protein FrsA (DUF1100 family)
VFSTFVTALESRLVFFPTRGEDVTPAALGIAYQRVELTTSDGERLMAWQLEPERPVADVVYFHGNGGNLSVWLPVLATLHARRMRVLAVDYRGYGLSSGTPTEDGVYLDAAAAVAYTGRERAAGASRPLAYWGRSLGGAVAAAATRMASPDGLILESTFPEKSAVIRHQPVLRALNAFSAYRFPTHELLRDYTRPVLVMHGDSDSIIPFALGRELFDRLGGRKQFVAIRGGDHNDAFDSDDEAYWAPVMAFIESLGVGDR